MRLWDSLRTLAAALSWEQKVLGTYLVLWSEQYRTPRSVWVGSAIAATLFHAGVLWWGINAWQSRRDTTPPAPIQVIALPPESEAVFDPVLSETVPTPSESQSTAPSSPRETTESVASANSTPPAQTSTPRAVEPVEPVAPAPISPQRPALPARRTPPVAPVTPQPTPEPRPEPIPEPAATTPSPPTSPPVPNPTPPIAPIAPTPSQPPATSPPNPPASPPTEPAVEQERPFPVTAGEVSPREVGINAFWTLQEVPDGSDLPDQFPAIPQGWRESTSALLSNAECSSGLVAPGSSVRVTLWPIVEADGRISGFFSWDGGDNVGKERVIACIESLGSQMAPLVPARTSGEAIPSYAMLLVVEVSGTQ